MEQYYSTIEELRKHWYDSTDNVCPYKLVSGGRSQRFAFGDIAMDAFEVEEGTAILFDHSNEQTKVLAYKYIQPKV